MSDERYMHRALELAKNGLGNVSPNPMVGCVIVCNNTIIGEGWHHKFGEAHAEVNAICSVKEQHQLKDSTVYVTLEPCSFKGKTPACSKLLIQVNVKKVVISVLDPNPKVAGNGVEALLKAGIEVNTGVLAKEAIKLNRRFFVNQKLNRPYVLLKWAQTKDGFIARSNNDSKWISNVFSRQLTHRWRSEEDAILVGKKTAYYDNPSLTVRDWDGASPIRVVLDRNLELSKKLNLFNGEVETLVYNLKEDKTQTGYKRIKLQKKDFLTHMLTDLYTRGLGSVMVEGGSQILEQFIQKGLWDEARVFTSEQYFGEGIDVAKISGEVIKMEQVNNDELVYYYNSKSIKHWQKN